jgi:sigma-E factor negative regulatory protein RseA
MSEEIREQLSALVDDELDELERPLLLGRLQRDRALRETLGRYELIGEVLRGSGQPAALGVASRVEAALSGDAALHGAEPMHGASRWWKPLAGVAVAASVAVVAVYLVHPGQQDAGPTLANAPAPEIRTVEVQGEGGEQWARIQPQVDERLSGYLVNHNEYAASRGVQGVMPYVRIVGFENGEQ